MSNATTACQLCGTTLTCTSDNACWCHSVQPDAGLLAWLKTAGREDACLCKACLAGRVPSPCLSICELSDAGEDCRGCGRTLDEIGAWGLMSSTERAAVWLRLNERNAQ